MTGVIGDDIDQGLLEEQLDRDEINIIYKRDKGQKTNLLQTELLMLMIFLLKD